MIRYKLIVSLLIIVFASLAGCKSVNYKKISNGIVISLKQNSPNEVKTIRLQVVNNDIIHITATPTKNISNIPSLIATFKPNESNTWKVSQQTDNVELQTLTTKAIVSLKTGEIKFTDLKGNII